MLLGLPFYAYWSRTSQLRASAPDQPAMVGSLDVRQK
jgi:hypothetical protein